MPILIVYATAAIMIAALFPLPEAYLSILNILAFGTFAWGAYRNFEPFGPMTILAVVYALFAIVFNPISPVILPAMVWKTVDIAGAVLLLVTGRIVAK